MNEMPGVEQPPGDWTDAEIEEFRRGLAEAMKNPQLRVLHREAYEHTLCDDIHQVFDGQTRGFFRITVTSSVQADDLRPTLGPALADVVRARCYGKRPEAG